MHFQLFIPHGHRPLSGPEAMHALFLSSETDGASYYECKAPDWITLPEGIDTPEGVESIAGKRGQHVSWQRPGQTKFHFEQGRQLWRPAARHGDQECGRYWIGFDREHPPTPGDLARAYRYPGVNVQLGDGQTWLLPKASQLPSDLVLADDGTWRMQLQRRFWDFNLETASWMRILSALEEGDPYDFAGLSEFVRKALAINYRTLPEVVSHLRLFNTQNIQPVAAHVILASHPPEVSQTPRA